jgi:hypothetical protein
MVGGCRLSGHTVVVHVLDVAAMVYEKKTVLIRTWAAVSLSLKRQTLPSSSSAEMCNY